MALLLRVDPLPTNTQLTGSTPRRITPLFILLIVIVSFAIRAALSPAFAQGVQKDNGHCALNGRVVLACWNSLAGSNMPKNFADYPEFLPSLAGWDFRINLPHSRFQLARAGMGSGPVMIGVVEDATDLYDTMPVGATVPIVKDYGHRNNSIWMFRTNEADGQIYVKVLPSRRDLNGSATENTRALTSGWIRVRPPAGRRFKAEPPAVVAIGKGLGSTTIYVVARGADDALYMSKHLVSTATFFSWSDVWAPVGVTSVVRPALSEAFNGKLALATWSGATTSRIDVRLYDPAAGRWKPRVSAGSAAARRPQLVWDGTALNVFFVANNRVQHTFSLSDSPLKFPDPVEVSNLLLVVADDYHAMAFNNRLHVVVRRASGAPPPQQVWYTTTTTPYGQPSQWTDPSFVGFSTSQAPKIASLYENLFVIGVGPNGRVVYSRRDPNRPGTVWLDQGTAIDPAIVGAFSDLDILWFNSDLYLAGSKVTSVSSAAGAYVLNFGRAAMRQLITAKWGMRLLWGGPGGAAVKGVGGFAAADETPAIGDFNRDGRDDLIKFTQKEESGVGPAPVYVSLNDGTFGDNTLWHRFFSLKGEIPMVGDFNGDGKDDIVTFTQQLQKDAAGNVIGPAVVWVSLSNGRSFGRSAVWHRFFSLKGEIPMVGDFNGDGKDDIVTFTQQLQKDAAGNVIGPAVVWVSLSDGTRFQPSTVWHRFFSLKGEIPMVGDFNGDRKDDIVTFTQQLQKDAAGNVIGNAVVWVSLSNGTRFGQSSVWHTFFSLKGEIPQVGDVNMDGRDDIVTFLRGQGTPPDRARNVFAALSLGNRFARSITWHSDFVAAEQARLQNSIVRSPLIGRLAGTTLCDITGLTTDCDRPLPDIFAFRNDGAVHVATAMGTIPYSPAAPWEYYKWFTEKGIGVAYFPEWIWAGPNHCLGVNHRFAVQGLAGSGGGDTTISSVRLGGRAGHILEELGHSVFANCFRKSNDPSQLFTSIFETSTVNGGIDANNMPDCPSAFYDCRDPEHYFLGLLSKYRIHGDTFRAEIRSETDAGRKARLNAQYDWLKMRWFEGQEFKRGPSINASLTQDGVPCLPAECDRARYGPPKQVR